ncbi:hypothetical protein ACEQ8H_001060 [Pleosporales sp. CAS-2024a]
MSPCSPAVRAIGRSRAPGLSTLLPFLYHTATIRRWKPAPRTIARRSISSRPGGEHHIPFEDAEAHLRPTRDVQSARKTTITDTERAAFEKLYKTFKTGQGRRKGEGGEHEELDQIADEYYEDEDEGSDNELDKVFEEALQGAPRLRRTQSEERTIQPGMKKIGEHVVSALEAPAPQPVPVSVSVPDTPLQRKKLAAKAEKDRIKKLRLEERKRIDELFLAAQTDVQLWQILHGQVFDQLRKLDLDQGSSSSSSPTKKEQKPGAKAKANSSSMMDTRILFPNYPYHLINAVKLMHAYFPRSPLPLAILPTVKSLGRSSYALGATTQLYKFLLRIAWIQQASYSLVDSLLTDMESNMIEFDMGILEVLDGIVRENDLARAGHLGKEMKMVYAMDAWEEGITKIKAWRDLIAQRLHLGTDPSVTTKMKMMTMMQDSNSARGVPKSPFFRHMKPVPSTLHTSSREAIPFVSKLVRHESDSTSPSSPLMSEEEALQILERQEPPEPEDAADRPAKIIL